LRKTPDALRYSAAYARAGLIDYPERGRIIATGILFVMEPPRTLGRPLGSDSVLSYHFIDSWTEEMNGC
jgi:hypothetical protein